MLRESDENMNHIFMNGSSANLHEMLKVLYPDEAEPWFNGKHVITKIGQYFYDIRGIVSGRGYRPMSEYHDENPIKHRWSDMLLGKANSDAHRDLHNIYQRGKRYLRFFLDRRDPEELIRDFVDISGKYFEEDDPNPEILANVKEMRHQGNYQPQEPNLR